MNTHKMKQRTRFSRKHGDRAVSILLFFTEEITSHETATWETDNNVLYTATCLSHQHISLSHFHPHPPLILSFVTLPEIFKTGSP